MIGTHGGRTYNILLDEVITALEKNRDEHQEIMEEAQEAFHAQAIKAMEKQLADAKKGLEFRLSINLSVPRSYLKEYDNAIDLLKANQRAGEDKIALTAQEYECFVRNKWPWFDAFKASTVRYSAKAADL